MDKNIGKYKIVMFSICLNQPYWQYISPMIESARKFLLKGHDVDFFVWTDMPEETNLGQEVKIFPTAPCDWPLPTLFRYHLFLQQEELLKQFDYIFYCDADMLFVSRVGNEILGEGLTVAAHPMYALRPEYIHPYEPNSQSTAYIPSLGRVLENPKRFEPFYAAGGFQGGRTENFIQAMKIMKEGIDKDFANNYIARWNDESHWNRYLFDNPPSVFLSPSFVYPDSLNKAFYQKVWGRNYVPKLITLTKPFSLSKDGGANLQHKLKNL